MTFGDSTPPLTPKPTAWAKFRAWPVWGQVLMWLFLWPVPLALLALARPPSNRPKFIALAVAGAVLWVGMGVSGAASDGGKDAQTAAPTTTHEVGPPTTKAPTTTKKPAPTTTPTKPPSTTVPPTTAPPTTVPPTTAPPATAPPAPEETVSQQNARQKAAEYLDYTAFSRTGLIQQLVYEGFTQADATYGADAVNADWNEQAAKKAAEYLDYSAFSHSGLIEQLVYEGFTQAEAEYGVSTTGL